jgi:hypothetical protein
MLTRPRTIDKFVFGTGSRGEGSRREHHEEWMRIKGHEIGFGTKVGSLGHLKTREESSLWASDEL